MLTELGPQLVQKGHELVVGQEVLVQHVGVLRQPVVQEAQALVHRLVASHHARLRLAQRLVARAQAPSHTGKHLPLRRPPQPLPKIPGPGQVEDQAARPVRGPFAKWWHRLGLLCLLVGVDDGLPEEAARCRRQVRVRHPDRVVPGHLRGEVGREVLVVHDGGAQPVHLAVDEVELHIENDADQPVATDHGREQRWLLVRAHPVHAAVREHDPHRGDRRRQAACSEVQPVGFHRHRAADAEDVDARHGRYREARGVHRLQHLVPGRPGLHDRGPRLLIDRDGVHAPHIHDEATRV
nr:hypothetical protein [Serinicoccus hydrothermalis]